MSPKHIPVLLNEVLADLNPLSGQVFIDGTLGFGGHAEKIISKIGPTGTYLGIDQDPAAIAHCQEWLPSPPFQSAHGNFETIAEIATKVGLSQVDGILADLGISSYQLDHPERGFSFQGDTALDMRMNSTAKLTAAKFLKTASEEELQLALNRYTDLRKTERFVANIVSMRKASTILRTPDLVTLIKKSFYFHDSRGRFINTCQQVFQALRMTVNRELDVLAPFVESAIHLLRPGGRLAIITFHSIEDREIKRLFEQKSDVVKLVRKKVVKPGQSEIRFNRRAKSAKMRVVEKLP